MDPKPSYKIPIYLRQSYSRGSLKPKYVQRLRETAAEAFTKDRNMRNRSEITLRLNMTLNPYYSIEYRPNNSHMRATHKNFLGGKRSQEFLCNDKSFFRKRDEITRFAEKKLTLNKLYAQKLYS